MIYNSGVEARFSGISKTKLVKFGSHLKELNGSVPSAPLLTYKAISNTRLSAFMALLIPPWLRRS